MSCTLDQPLYTLDNINIVHNIILDTMIEYSLTTKTRLLLKEFTTGGISDESIEELLDLANEHAPSIVKLLFHLRANECLENEKIKCPPEWSEFIRCLCSTSPVCAVIHPLEKLINFLKKKSEKSASAEFPVLFNLLKRIKYIPESPLSPVMCALKKHWPRLLYKIKMI